MLLINTLKHALVQFGIFLHEICCMELTRGIYTLLDIALHKSIFLRPAHSCPHKIRIIAVFILL